MAQITTLKDKEGKTLYPITSSKAVLDENGLNIDDRFQSVGDVSSATYDGELEAIEPSLANNSLRKNEQLLTDSEQAQVLKNLGNPEFKLFVDMWNQACGTYGTYNEGTGFFELNGLTDLTYEEALEIMQNSASMLRLVSSGLPSYALAASNIRTTFPLGGTGNAYGGCGLKGTFKNCKKLEAVIILNGNVAELNDTFYDCEKLKSVTINNEYGLSTISASAFHNCYVLETLKFRSIKSSFSVQYAPKITLESFSYIIARASNTSPITITVHPTVYAKLTDESNEEWNALLALAASKNIQFATV